MRQPDGLVFTDLKELCQLSDGNLNRHLEVLKTEGLVEVWKKHDRRPQTLVKLTPQGMDFALGGQLRNVLDSGTVTSELRMEIVRRLGKKFLHIPSGQGAKAAK